jgi:hypothetical protein
MKSLTKTKKIVLLTAAFLLVVPSLLVLLPGRGSAATLTNTYIRLNRLKIGPVATSFRLVFKAASIQTADVSIDFNGTDTGTARWTDVANGPGVVNATQSVATAQCVTDGFTALPGGSLAAAGSGSVVTISGVGATTTVASPTYCVDLTSTTAVTNPTTAGEYHPTVTIGTDSTTIALRIIAEDQVVVTATVPPSFNFLFNNTSTDAFGNLDPAAVKTTTGKTITLTTNANSGWIVWAKSSQGATTGSLHSTVASKFITSASSLGSAAHNFSAGSEDYGLAATIGTDAGGGGTVTLDNAYNGTGSCPSTCNAGVLDSQNFRPIASANGTANGDVINVFERATIAGSTPAANDYTDTITFIGAGNF